jgi:hypothetical protein
VAVLLVLIALALLAPAAQARPLDRPDDPVVLTGAATPSLTGAAPGDIVAFAWTGKWRQVPVQVDERKLFDLRLAYPDPFSCAGNGLCYLPFVNVAKLRYFTSPLSLPYVLERLTPQLEAAVAGKAPKRVVTP